MLQLMFVHTIKSRLQSICCEMHSLQARIAWTFWRWRKECAQSARCKTLTDTKHREQKGDVPALLQLNFKCVQVLESRNLPNASGCI